MFAPVTVTGTGRLPAADTEAPVRVMVLLPVIVSVPPPTLEVPLVTVKPVGSVSVKATPVSVVLAFELVMVKVRVVVPATRIDVGLNEAAIEGADTTVRVLEVAVLPVPPLVELTAPVVVVYEPAVAPVTVTGTGRLPAADTEAPVRVMVLPPVIVSVPPPTLELPLAAVKPLGSVSVKATPLSEVPEFELVMVKVRVVVPFTATDVGLNEAAIEGADTTMRVLEVAVLPVPPLVELTAPVVVVYEPAVAPVTVTGTGRLLAAATEAPVRVMVLPPVIVSVPPPTLEVPLVTVKPVGSVSVKATPFSVVLVFELVMVNVRVLVPFTAMDVGLNEAAIEGAEVVEPRLNFVTNSAPEDW